MSLTALLKTYNKINFPLILIAIQINIKKTLSLPLLFVFNDEPAFAIIMLPSCYVIPLFNIQFTVNVYHSLPFGKYYL